MEQHLQVQRQIEQRAYQLWRAQDGADSRTLDHWLKAEAEVLAEFLQAWMPPPGRIQVRNGRTSSWSYQVAYPRQLVPKQPPNPYLQCQR